MYFHQKTLSWLKSTHKNLIMKNSIHAALMGIAVGDALGVPVEFMSRSSLDRRPVSTMQEYGTHHQPQGTWSDDSSLAFCLAESLCKGYDTQDIAEWFVAWYFEGKWTPHGRVFDAGRITIEAIRRLKNGTKPTEAGGGSEDDNGNGGLMRILPLVFYLQDFTTEQRYLYVKEVASITHKHIRSVIACFVYIEYALCLLKGDNKETAYQNICKEVSFFLKHIAISSNELSNFKHIFNGGLPMMSRQLIHSSGYVLHTLEAALWCVLTSSSYSETVLKAVNLGEDTDTTAAVAGGLAGMLYGFDNIPQEWRNVIVKQDLIIDLANRLENKIYSLYQN
ncbi:MAG: ADP-ribosylglycohydrolase family protein [Thermoflexibacteraceae bacterium]|jgi:ADP-ribosyl-[dinitrogen reductase] hydrolase